MTRARQFEMFAKPPRPHVWRMHVCDAGNGEEGKPICKMRCRKCGHESGWIEFDTVTEAKRGLPCPTCNGMIDGCKPPSA